MSLADALSPITQNFSLKDHIYVVLREAILKMNIYQPGVDLRLDERKLAEQLNVSRTPIREALARLSQDGLVVILPRKGVFVQRKSRDEILEMIVTWAALESMAARLATQAAGDADFRQLRKFAVKHSADAEKAELEEYSDANIRFHQRIFELSGCKLLKTTADTLFAHMHAVRRRAMGEGNRASRSVVDHMEIIEALERRDADRAARLVREHTMRLHDHVRRTWTRFESINQSTAELT
jgi:DNA-binding GntR family transcriptional regulator